MLWYYTRRMNRYLSHELEKRWTAPSSSKSTPATRTIIDLALEQYLSEQQHQQPSSADAKKIDTDFRTSAINQTKVFL